MTAEQLRNSLLQEAISGRLVPPACRQAGKTLTMNPTPHLQGKKVWFTYVIECEDGTFYKGFTDDLVKRYKQHCDGIGAEHTKIHKPKQLYYWEMHYSQKEAIAREKYLKSGSGREWFLREVVNKPENWEPASVLLARIREEKERLIKEKKLKKEKPSAPITEDEIPYEIPATWEWVRIADISQSYIGLTYSPSDVCTNGMIVLRSSNIKGGKLDLKDVVRVKKDISDRLLVNVNDIIICARNGSRKLVGKSALITEMPEPMTFGAFMAICKTKFYQYVYWFLQSDLFFSQLRKVSDTTTINQLTQNNFNSFVIPLPPLAEQQRIVAKLEELLPIVEQYGKAQTELDELNAALPARLRQSILQEAIQGKLVPQDPNEGTAEELLKHIEAEKQQLIKEGKLKKEKSSAPIAEDEIPFEIPNTWKWVRHNYLFGISGGTQPPKSEFIYEPREGYIQLYQIRDYGKNPQPVYIPYKKTLKISKEGDILLARYGASLGKVFFAKDGAYNVAIARVIPQYTSELIDKKYIYWYYRSSIYQRHITDRSRCAQAGFNKEDLNDLYFPLPPLAEQKRIVAKIEELFAEIDKMK